MVGLVSWSWNSSTSWTSSWANWELRVDDPGLLIIVDWSWLTGIKCLIPVNQARCSTQFGQLCTNFWDGIDFVVSPGLVLWAYCAIPLVCNPHYEDLKLHFKKKTFFGFCERSFYISKIALNLNKPNQTQ